MDALLKVLIADDHPLVLQGIRRALECSDGIEVVGEARSGDEVLALVKRRSPHLVLLDLRMPGLGGLECIAELKRSSPDIKTVVLSACDDRASIDAALLAGASAYMVRSVSPVDIPTVLRQAATGPFTTPSAPIRVSEPRTHSGSDLTHASWRSFKRSPGLTTKAISQDCG
jgi:DNA-binding NarL/FixJ family response regulator